VCAHGLNSLRTVLRLLGAGDVRQPKSKLADCSHVAVPRAGCETARPCGTVVARLTVVSPN
jgi:hypothetical protein